MIILTVERNLPSIPAVHSAPLSTMGYRYPSVSARRSSDSCDPFSAASTCGAASAAIAIAIQPTARINFLPLDNLYLICHVVAAGSTAFISEGIEGKNWQNDEYPHFSLHGIDPDWFYISIVDQPRNRDVPATRCGRLSRGVQGARPVDRTHRPFGLHALQPVLRQPRRRRALRQRGTDDVHGGRDGREPDGRGAAGNGRAVASGRRQGADLDRGRCHSRLLGRLEGPARARTARGDGRGFGRTSGHAGPRRGRYRHRGTAAYRDRPRGRLYAVHRGAVGRDEGARQAVDLRHRFL